VRTSRGFWGWFRIILLIVVVLAVGMFVLTCYLQNRPDTGPEPPALEQVGYSVTIKATGQTFYTAKVLDMEGVVTMFGYWETVKDRYKFKDIKLPLDRKIFGEIEVRKR